MSWDGLGCFNGQHDGYANSYVAGQIDACFVHHRVSDGDIRYCGRPWPAAYINFNQNIHQIQALTKPLCRAQAIFYSLPNNEWGTKYRGLTYSTK